MRKEVIVAQGISNRNGRALEFSITSSLSDLKNSQLTLKASKDLEKDKYKFDSLALDLQEKYLLASDSITKWIYDSFSTDKITIDKSSDNEKGSWDIQVSSQDKTINLSVKHNHSALKHPRPYSLAQMCGYKKGSPQDVKHRNNMRKLALNYRENAIDQINFNENPTLLHDMLQGVSNACSISINEWMNSDLSLPSNIFDFMVSKNFYQVVVSTKGKLSVNLYDYISIKPPTLLKIAADRHYLNMEFDNSWFLSARLHNASSKIGSSNRQLSLKFDVQKIHGDVREISLI